MAIKSFQQQLVDLFNAKNTGLAQALSVADVDFSITTVLESGTGGRDSKLTITAKAESEHFTSNLELHYSRLSAEVVGAKAVTAALTDWDTDAEVLAVLNADVITAGKTEDAFTAEELSFERTGTGTDADPLVIVVSINPGHIKYREGVIATYTVTEEIVKTDLSTTDGELDGFTA